MLLYDLLTRDYNALVADPCRKIRGTQFLSRSETLHLFPQIVSDGLSGAAVFEDGQMYNPPRLVLGFVAAATALGASVANHVEAERFLMAGRRVVGATARDRLTGERFEIRARLVINATGPWAEGLLQSDVGAQVSAGVYSRDACLVVARRPTTRLALAVQGRTRDSDALLARNARHMFLVPWRSSTLIGVWHSVVERDPDNVNMSRDELRAFVDEINACYPALALEESEVTMAGFGLVPFGAAARQSRDALSFGKQSRLIDHARTSGLLGLLSLISVRYTVARKDAATVLDAAAEHLGQRGSGAESTRQHLPGGDIEDFAAFVVQLKARWPSWLPPASCEGFAQNYGSTAWAILAFAERQSALKRCLPGSNVSHAEVIYAVREEMAHRMADIVFRRTDLGTDGHPGSSALDEVQELMRRECSWSEQRTAQERAAVELHLQRYLAQEPGPAHGTGGRRSPREAVTWRAS
jgi:glycerol-3-phosphate dehydrogenase